MWPELPGRQGTSRPLQRCRRRAEPRLGLLMPSLSPRYDEGSGGSGDEGRDETHKREWNLFYQKQMSLRKVRRGDGAGPRWPPAHTLSALPWC